MLVALITGKIIKYCPKKKSFPLRISATNVTKYTGTMRIWSHLMNKYQTENFGFCPVV